MLARLPGRPLLIYDDDCGFCLRRIARWLIAGYRWVAARLDRSRTGHPTPSRRRVRWLFLRGMGVVYLFAFSSLHRQVLGLYGRDGIRPVAGYLDNLRRRFGSDAYRRAPSLLWLGASDGTLRRLCQGGQLAALALTLGIAPRALLLALWATYLSFVTTGREFLSYQWDALLLEAGLLATLLAPGGLRPGLGEHEPSRTASALLRWLGFRLHFESGVAKLQAHDPAWRRFEACRHHHATQPLPTPIGWYAHHLPRAVHRLSTGAVLAIELGAPLLGLGPQRVRAHGFVALAALQALIAATGNYGFFNLLSLLPALFAFDDQVLPARTAHHRRLSRATRAPLWRRVAVAAAALPLAAASLSTFAARFGRTVPPTIERVRATLARLRSVNSYGLFAVMTTNRPEIVIEGSDDGLIWRELVFRYKPGDPRRAPRWIAPHQPRLDWQMWFAAMGAPPVWFASFVLRLLEGSPHVLALLGENPFPDHPPRLVRALLYDYRPTDLETKVLTGRWWQRRPLRVYFPACSLAGAP